MKGIGTSGHATEFLSAEGREAQVSAQGLPCKKAKEQQQLQTYMDRGSASGGGERGMRDSDHSSVSSLPGL